MGDDTTAISWHDAEAMKPYLQNQTRLAALGVAGVLIFGGWTLSARADSTLRNAMQAQREYFLTNYSPRLQTNVQSAVWLNTFLSDLGTSAERPQTAGDNRPVGILLCTRKDHALVEYALGDLDNRLFVSKCQLELPSREEIQRFLEVQFKGAGDE